MPARGSSLSSLPALVAAGVLAAALPAAADTLVFQDGRRVQGRLISVSRGWVEFQPIEGEDTVDELRVAVAEVRAIQFDDGRDTSDRVGGGPAGRGDRVEDEPVLSPRGRRGSRTDAGGGAGDDIGIGPRPRGGDGTGGVRRAADRRRGRMITVEAARPWTDTGVDVVAGDIISFSVAGTVTLGDDRSLGAAGDTDGATAAARRPLPDRPAGALIGRIGSSPDDTFFIGAERLPFRVRTSGRLFLGVNDDTRDDDDGAFQVGISSGS